MHFLPTGRRKSLDDIHLQLFANYLVDILYNWILKKMIYYLCNIINIDL